MVTALSRRDEGFTTEELIGFLRRRLDEHVLDVSEEYATLTFHLDAEGYVETARLLHEDERLAFTMFDCLFGIDAREEGFDVVAILYSVETGRRVLLRHRCAGGREAPVAPTLTGIYVGANWHEREAWDMFGIEFEGHPGLAPRILCAENFEGWPLRKDFYLATREAKPWPGVKEPAELDEDGNIIERVPGPGDAAGPTALDEVMAKQARLANPVPEDELPEEVDVVASSEDEGAATPSDLSEQPDARAAESAAERRDQMELEAESTAKVRAEQQRVEAAEARARKAAERAEEGPVTTPAEDVPDVPQGAARDPGDVDAGGPPASGTHEGSGGARRPVAQTEGGLHETVDEARERGEATPDPSEAPVQPEGRTSDDADAAAGSAAEGEDHEGSAPGEEDA